MVAPTFPSQDHAEFRVRRPDSAEIPPFEVKAPPPHLCFLGGGFLLRPPVWGPSTAVSVTAVVVYLEVCRWPAASLPLQEATTGLVTCARLAGGHPFYIRRCSARGPCLRSLPSSSPLVMPLVTCFRPFPAAAHRPAWQTCRALFHTPPSNRRHY